LRQISYQYLGLGGRVPIPEWTDDEICDIERLDVHGSRCRCQYCKTRFHEVTLQHAAARARREIAAENAAADKARSELAKLQAAHPKIFRPVTIHEPKVRFITDAEYLEWVRYLSPDVRLTERDQQLLRQSRLDPEALYFVHVEPTGEVRRDPAGRTILPPDPYYGIVWC
jgi:hypothetical protein